MALFTIDQLYHIGIYDAIECKSKLFMVTLMEAERYLHTPLRDGEKWVIQCFNGEYITHERIMKRLQILKRIKAENNGSEKPVYEQQHIGHRNERKGAYSNYTR